MAVIAHFSPVFLRGKTIILFKFRMLFLTTDYADYTDFLSSGFQFLSVLHRFWAKGYAAFERRAVG
ncbi:MAG: hypothetical protein IJT75_09430, partial [Bacteroidaceae bacterium]|nr:hypothetical protein [Bacteroidaceae bacterium]